MPVERRATSALMGSKRRHIGQLTVGRRPLGGRRGAGVVGVLRPKSPPPPPPRVYHTRPKPQCVLCAKFGENPEFRVGNFAVNLKREISHAKLKCHETPTHPV